MDTNIQSSSDLRDLIHEIESRRLPDKTLPIVGKHSRQICLLNTREFAVTRPAEKEKKAPNAPNLEPRSVWIEDLNELRQYLKDQHDIIEEQKTLIMELRGQRTEYEECKRENEDKSKVIKELNCNLCAKDLEIMDLNAEMCSIQSTKDNLVRCLDKERIVSAQKENHLRDLDFKVAQISDGLQQRLKELLAENQDLQHQNTKMKNDVEFLRSRMHSEQMELVQKLKENQLQLEEMKTVQESEQTHVLKVQSIQEKLKKSEIRNEQQQEEIEQLMGDKTMLMEKMEMMENNLKELKSETWKMEGDNLEMRSQVESRDKDIESLNTRLSEMQLQRMQDATLHERMELEIENLIHTIRTRPLSFRTCIRMEDDFPMQQSEHADDDGEYIN